MFLYHGSDATTSVAISMLPRICQHLLRHLDALAGGQSAEPAARSDADFGKQLDVYQMESLLLKFQGEAGFSFSVRAN